MDSSFEMFNRSSSYFPIYPYSLSIPSDFRSNTTNDYYHHHHHPDNTLNVYSPNTTGVDQYNNNGSPLLMSRSDRCLVCNDRASGIHFGVSTCEACKAFFRRTSLSSYPIPHPCSPNRCEINTKNRNNCPSCRFDKCKRLGMDRDNVIYGKPSKQQMNSSYNQDYFLKQLTNISNELIQIYQTLLSNSFENKQQIDSFATLTFQLFYEQTSQFHNINSSDIIHRIFSLIFNSYKNNYLSDSYLNQNFNLQAILSIWLFVYYYETFLFKQKISHDKLTILIKLLDIELEKFNEYYHPDENKRRFFRIDFINTFTKFTDLLHEIK